jgi:glycosyltransferase involved in cell wall biosynthesis
MIDGASAMPARANAEVRRRHGGHPGQIPDALVSVVIPSFDEERTIEEIIRRVAAVPFRTEIIVVDDGSTDDTAAILARLEGEVPQLSTLPQPVNRGTGAAVRVGIAQSRGDVVVIQDADVEYDPADLSRLLEPLLRGVADAVYGTRLRGASRSAPTSSGTTPATASCHC